MILPACLATERQTLMAASDALLTDDADDLREIEEVEVAGVHAGDLGCWLVGMVMAEDRYQKLCF